MTNQRGIALMMVLTTITVLTAIMADFTFESKVAKFQSVNIQNRGQARLNAQSGLEFALVRLQIYQQAFNLRETNDSIKQNVKAEMLNKIWQFPFAMPLPILPKMGPRLKAELQKFAKANLLPGELNLSIRSIAGKLNLNLMRVEQAKTKDSTQNNQQQNQNTNKGKSFTEEFSELFARAFRDKVDSDEAFSDRYSNIDPQELVYNLVYYISDPGAWEGGFRATAEKNFSDLGITPKMAPISHIDELSLVPGWDDELVNLIKNEISAHPIISVDINELTERMLKLIVPDLDEKASDAFYAWKNDPEDPQYFNELDDLKSYFTSNARIVSSQAFDERIAELKKLGLQFSASPSLFEVISTGRFDQTGYTLQAIVSIPALPLPDHLTANTTNTNQGTNENEEGSTLSSTQNETSQNEENNNSSTNKETEKKQPTILLIPRVLEVKVIRE